MKPVGFVQISNLEHLEAQALTTLFDSLNGEFFKGRLPHYRIVYAQPPGNRACSGYCDPDTRTIYVDPNPPTQDGLRRILLHEMCHVGSLGHGKRFRAKLLRLAAAGETWASKEAADYAQLPRRSPASEIAARIRDIAIDLTDYDWSQIEALLATELGRSLPELHRAAPWAERLWRRAVSEIKQNRDATERFRQKRAGT